MKVDDFMAFCPYQSPECVTLGIHTEQILCSSTSGSIDDFTEIDDNWN